MNMIMESIQQMAQLCLAMTVVLVMLINDCETSTIASTWNSCSCSWLPWESWGSCDKKCFGRRRRMRKVSTTCTKFTDCATDDMGFDYGNCSSFCFNGGSADVNNACDCTDGWTGTCCDEVITCGKPVAPVQGDMYGSSYRYGDAVFYSCNHDYNISGSLENVCGGKGAWTQTTPQCIYVNTCSSSPCLNEAECVNGLNQYSCRCKTGYSGRHCENDVQPPVVQNCSESFYVNATTHTTTVNWIVPEFSDPFGNNLILSSNYDNNEETFQWGDFTVQYVATKPSNGLRTECNFTISVRPTPCPDLTAPEGGAVVCNGWVSDYARICQVFCKGDKFLVSGDDHRQQYVCGADGQWTPSLPLPKCLSNLPPSVDDISVKYDVNDYKFSSCNADKNKMATTYIGRLTSSGFSDLCHSYTDLCNENHVNVICS